MSCHLGHTLQEHSAECGAGNICFEEAWHVTFLQRGHLPTLRLILGLGSPISEWGIGPSACAGGFLCTLTPQGVKVEALVSRELRKVNTAAEVQKGTSGTGRRQPWDHKQYECLCLLSQLQRVRLLITGKYKLWRTGVWSARENTRQNPCSWVRSRCPMTSWLYFVALRCCFGALFPFSGVQSPWLLFNYTGKRSLTQRVREVRGRGTVWLTLIEWAPTMCKVLCILSAKRFCICLHIVSISFPDTRMSAHRGQGSRPILLTAQSQTLDYP